jgi:ATP-dependent DNA ligase
LSVLASGSLLQVRQQGFNVMLAKRMSSSYQRGRSLDWLKI